MNDNFFDDFDIDIFADVTAEVQNVSVIKRSNSRHTMRSFTCEQALEEALDWHFDIGDCYHCFSFGDVDSLSYLKHIIKQQHCKYICISTWCMAKNDVAELRRWHKLGLVDRIDFYVGEIFNNSYAGVYDECRRFINECGGRLVVFRNHAKIMMIKGDRFDCLIESSANVNTNPRSENTVITVDSTLTDEYINLFGRIRPFNKDYGAEPYKVKL